MIKIEKQGDHTQTTISGCEGELFNDCRALINEAYKSTDFGEIFLAAWNNVIEERIENDKNNISNKD